MGQNMAGAGLSMHRRQRTALLARTLAAPAEPEAATAPPITPHGAGTSGPRIALPLLSPRRPRSGTEDARTIAAASAAAMRYPSLSPNSSADGSEGGLVRRGGGDGDAAAAATASAASRGAKYLAFVQVRCLNLAPPWGGGIPRG